jgi:uncharacterized protein
MFEVSLNLLMLLLGAAFLAGFIDAIAGGGGLITLPVLLLAGASPIEALSTNKVQGSFGAATAAISYARAGQVDLKAQRVPALIALIAGLFGAVLATRLPTETLRLIIPVILIAVALFFALKRGLSDEDQIQRIKPEVFMALFVPLIGTYDGMIGPGAGAFYMIGFVTLAGYGILKATAHTKLLNFSSNIGGLVIFAIFGATWWFTGIAMGIAQVAGAALGARLAVRVGANLIRPVLVITSVALALRVFVQML